MKTYHAYASTRFPIYETEHDAAIECDMSLRGWMLRIVFSQLPVTTPLRFVVPREVAWDALQDGYPVGLMDVEVVGGKAAQLDDPIAFNCPYDEAKLIAADWECVIHYRRYREYVPCAVAIN